jgi:hypothetical protein
MQGFKLKRLSRTFWRGGISVPAVLTRERPLNHLPPYGVHVPGLALSCHDRFQTIRDSSILVSGSAERMLTHPRAAVCCVGQTRSRKLKHLSRQPHRLQAITYYPVAAGSFIRSSIGNWRAAAITQWEPTQCKFRPIFAQRSRREIMAPPIAARKGDPSASVRLATDHPAPQVKESRLVTSDSGKAFGSP